MEIIKRLNRELVYKGTVINMYRDTVQVQNGHIAEWDFIGHKGAAAVVPVLDDGRVLMVKQYRNALDRMTIEVPAGGRDTTDEPTLLVRQENLRRRPGTALTALSSSYLYRQQSHSAMKKLTSLLPEISKRHISISMRMNVLRLKRMMLMN